MSFNLNLARYFKSWNNLDVVTIYFGNMNCIISYKNMIRAHSYFLFAID